MALTRPRYSQIPDSDYKNSCRIVTTTDVTLTGSAPLTYDGVTLVQYDRVLVAGQTDKTQNGIYSVSTLGSGSNGSWVRSKDANANDRLTAGMNTFIEEGTYTGQFWHLLTPGPIVLGVTELIFGRITGNAAGTSSQVQYNLNGSIAGAANLRYDYITGNVLIGGGTASNSNVTGALVVNGGVGVSGNINVGANVRADKFYTTNGLFWAANGLAFSSGLEVSEINTANTVLSNISTQVTSLRFDRDTGFSVTELDPGNVKISLGSSFKTWHVPGQADLVAAAEDEVTFFGNGIDITTNPTFPKAITFISNNSILEANIGAFYNYANANIGTLFLGNTSTQANIGAYQIYANANAAAQATSIDTLNANVSAANAAIQSLSANIGTLVGGASEALDTLLELGNALGNNSSFSSTIVTWLGNITANVTAANAAITILDANVGTLFLGNASTNANLGAYQLYANANAASQQTDIDNINSNVGAYQLYANANAASQQTDIDSINANIGAFYTYANANIGTLFLGNASTNANLGAYQLYANANAASQQTDINSINANVGAYQLYANANIGTLFLGNASTQANIGAYQTWANLQITNTFSEIDELYSYVDANAAAQSLALDTINANLGAYQLYSNANIGSIYNNLNTLDANIGAYQIYSNANIGAYQLYANANIGSIYNNLNTLDANIGSYQLYSNANIGAYQLFANANLATQTTNYDTLNANIGAFYTYANTIIGPSNTGNLVVNATTESVSAITGALVVKGGAGIAGNLYVAGNIYASNLTAISIGTLSVTDPLLYLTASNPYPYNYDIGFFSHYSTVPGFEQHTGIARDYTTNVWGFFSNLSVNPGATVNWTEANIIYDTVKLGDLIVSNTTQSTSTTSGALRVAGGVGIAGELYIANTGDVSANIGQLHNANIAINANLGAYQTWANNEISTINTNASNFQTFANASLGVSTTFVVTDSGSSEYVINGNINPSLYLIRGQTYNFAVNAVGHPFWIKTVPSIGIGDQYNDGVTNNGTDNGTVSFLVPLFAPDVLYYISQADASFTGQINVVNFSSLDANIGSIYNNLNTLDANIGTLFLGNASTQANIGAYQTYANATFTTYSDANVDVYLSTYTGDISAGNIVATGNVSANKFYTINGIYWSGNGESYSSSGGITYTAATSPPVSPTAGDQWYDTAEGILYEYMDDGDTDQWVDIITPTFSSLNPLAYDNDVTFGSNISVNGNIFITDGIFWSVNGAPYSTGGGGSFSGSDDVLRANVGAYQIYANANIGTLFLGNASINSNLGSFQTYANANIGTLFLGNATTNANLGAYQTWANTNFGTSTYSNTNVAAYLRQGANIGSGTTTGNLVANATTVSTNTTTGALVVKGGAGIAEALHVGTTGTFGGLLQTTATTAAISTSSGALYVAGGTGIIGNLHVGGNVIIASATNSNVVVVSTTTSTSSTTGALVVRGGAGIAGNAYISGNVILGSATTTSNVVITGTRTSTSTTTGALVVQGGAGIAGNINVGGIVTIAGNVTVAGALSGGVGYLLERANVVADSAPAITDISLIDASVMYWNANSTANVTANIRGNATTPLNSLMAVNQTATLALFLPISTTPYYVEAVKIDNTTVTPVWLNGNTILSGNANSIDVYTFTIIKTASATYKVFATQSTFQHTG
jgi:hypothetical protein